MAGREALPCIGRWMRTATYVDEDNVIRKTRAWLDQITSSVAPRPHLYLDPDRAALLVIDILHYFADPRGRCYLPATKGIVPRIGTLLSAWRDRGGSVVFTQHCHTGSNDLGMLGRFFSDYIREGEKEADIIPALTPLPGESVIKKTTYDAFLNTSLTDLLDDQRVSQVLITGVLTHMCCETTARSAFCRGFEVYVPVDAMATTSEARHLGSLLSMADAVAKMTCVDEVVSLCQGNRS